MTPDNQESWTLHSILKPCLCHSLSRLLSLKQVQESISETPCGTLGTPATRSGCCGRTPGMWAGRTRCPTAGSCSTGPRWATSGRWTTQLLTLHLSKAHPHFASQSLRSPEQARPRIVFKGMPRPQATTHRKGGGRHPGH